LAGTDNRALYNRVDASGTAGSAGSIIGRSGVVFDAAGVSVIYPSRCLALGNEINGTLEHGIKFYDGGKDNKAIGNTIRLAGTGGSSTRAIYVMGVNNPIIVGNTVESAGSVGIEVGDATYVTTGGTVSGNVIKGCTGVALLVISHNDVSVTGNQIVDNVTNGIQFQGSSYCSVTGNTIKNNGGNGGIVLRNSSDIAITGNAIRDNGVAGVAAGVYAWEATCDRITVSGNNIRDTRSAAARLQDYGVRLESGIGTGWNVSGNINSNHPSGDVSLVTGTHTVDGTNST